MTTDALIVRHSLYGPAIPARGWVPAPTYVLRRRRVLDHLSGKAPARILEVGCGAGAMLFELSQLGFDCVALETSASARQLSKLVNSGNSSVEIHATPAESWGKAFDTVLAMEVLEHIEDDLGTLRRWGDWLRPGGTLVLSVPAHPSLWNESDVWAGHFRRYTRAGLTSVVSSAGFRIIALECYGFPLSNLIDPIRARVQGRRVRAEPEGTAGSTRVRGSARSGTERDIETRLYPLQTSLPGTLVMRFFLALQRPFLRFDLGTGYILVAAKDQ